MPVLRAPCLLLALGAPLAAVIDPEPLAEASREEIERFLLRAEVVDRERLPAGVTRSHRVTLSEGGREAHAVWKTINDYEPFKRFYDGGLPEVGFRDSYKSEIAAYELDKILELGLVPPTVERKIGRRSGSLQIWLGDCVTEVERRRGGLHPPDGAAWGAQVYRYRVFHQLIGDTDFKNLSNVLVDPRTFRIWSIDHSRAFRIQGRLLETDYLKRFSRSQLDGLRRLERDELDEKLGRWLTREQTRSLLARRDRIVAHAEALVAERGEAAVLYD